MLSPDAVVADDVTFGVNVVVHGLVEIGAGAVIQDGVILGKLAKLAAHSTRVARPAGSARDRRGRGRLRAGDRVRRRPPRARRDRRRPGVRARARVVGERSVVGRGSAVDNDVEIRDRVRIQTGVYLTAYSLVEDDVFIGPTVSTYNDDTMARHADDYAIRGATLRRACRVGGGAKLRPGVEVGEEAFVAMGSVVTRDVPARKLVMGTPARVVRDVADAELLEKLALAVASRAVSRWFAPRLPTAA